MSFCKTVVVLQDRQKSMEAETKRLEEERKKDKEQSIQNKIKVWSILQPDYNALHIIKYTNAVWVDESNEDIINWPLRKILTLFLRPLWPYGNQAWELIRVDKREFACEFFFNFLPCVGRQGKLDRYTRNISFVFPNKRQPCNCTSREINVWQHSFHTSRAAESFSGARRKFVSGAPFPIFPDNNVPPSTPRRQHFMEKNFPDKCVFIAFVALSPTFSIPNFGT
jgi:hypothetical protein